MAEIKPFSVDWHAADVGKVLEEVRAYPWPMTPEVPEGMGWSYGCDGAFLKKLCDHWLDGYDWRGAVAELNRFPQFTARVEDFDIHFLHVVGEAGGKRPLLLSHGWPGSHYEFWGAIEKLAFPSRFGGDAADAFDVVVPSLPGFGFSSKPARPIGQRSTARLFNALMTDVLGYQTYLAQGGDWGAMVTSWLGFDHGAHAKAIHLNMLAFRPPSGALRARRRPPGPPAPPRPARCSAPICSCRSPSRSRWPGWGPAIRSANAPGSSSGSTTGRTCARGPSKRSIPWTSC